jgi:hypothetical protein
MEISCNRCHQPIEAESLYCRTCGLPQLVYSTEGNGAPTQPERWNEAVKDASAVEWKPALKAAMLLAIPAGLLSSGLTPMGVLGLLWMAAAAAWAVTVYVRRQRPAWITMGAGARIGLVTGVMAGALAFAITGVSLYVMRFFLNQGKDIDDLWTNAVNQAFSQPAANVDAQATAMFRGLFLSNEGRAGSFLGGMLILELLILIFAAAGGAIGARLMARSRRPEV